MFPTDQELSVSSSSCPVSRFQDFASSLNPMFHATIPSHDEQQAQKMMKKKRNLPGNPDPEAEVIALSPHALLATNRFVCEICNKGFQRDQNLQLHRRGHNLPWKLKQRSSKENRKRVYVCPEPACVHHHPSRALGDLTGIKKHYCRKHGEKKWKCQKCSKFYAVQSDWKAHSKTCGTREYRCDCGTLFSRKDSFITHRAFCDALAEESARFSAKSILLMHRPTHNNHTNNPPQQIQPSFHLNPLFSTPQQRHFPNPPASPPPPPASSSTGFLMSIGGGIPWDPQPPHHLSTMIKSERLSSGCVPGAALPYFQEPAALPMAPSSFLSATALLQKAASVGPTTVDHLNCNMTQLGSVGPDVNMMERMAQEDYLGFDTWQKGNPLTRDFLGLTSNDNVGREDHDHRLLSYGEDELFASSSSSIMYNANNNERDSHALGFGFAPADTTSETWGSC
ncbi:unnamed protein product [Cuscuta epithymum]|uniref:C2H2-type domain-containing protein n=1 Tax=Cuscuta epithymum TaxID=186058 RepID=A0AAV0FZ73_9ASTE|nr:unnamed protein product [Cuscuta epithymum]